MRLKNSFGRYLVMFTFHQHHWSNVNKVLPLECYGYVYGCQHSAHVALCT
jgi:hypothetical protein